MTKTEIIAELRRSAVEDGIPWLDVESDAYAACYPYKRDEKEVILFLEHDDCKTFFLLVACAMESE